MCANIAKFAKDNSLKIMANVDYLTNTMNEDELKENNANITKCTLAYNHWSWLILPL